MTNKFNKFLLTITNDPTANRDIKAPFNSEYNLLHFLENRWVRDNEDYGPMIVVGNDGEIEIHNASELLSALKKNGKLDIDFDDCYGHIKLEIL